MPVKPDPILLETFGVSSPQRLEIRAFLEPLSVTLTSKPPQAEEVQPIALGVVGEVGQFVSDDRPPCSSGALRRVAPEFTRIT